MQKYTTYSVAFPTSGVSFKGRFSPQPGLTAVIGPNGVGKTFRTIELTRYLLYGKKALRGKAADYKNLEAEGAFVIRDAEYLIRRGPKGEEVLDSAGNKLATGADAVTAKVTELMGYGLDVFDITNASVQKEADIFGQMSPSERKQKIDQVIGVLDAEAAEKACRTEMTMKRREAEALTRQLREPTEPAKPSEYRSSEDLEAELRLGRKQRAEYDPLLGQIRSVTLPKAPEQPRPSTEQIRALEFHQSERKEIVREYRRLDSIMSRARKLPSYTKEQLEIAAERLQLKGLLEQSIKCPHCSGEFVPGHGHIELPDGPDLTKQEIASEMLSLKLHDEYREAQVLQQALTLIEDRSELLDQLRVIEQEWLVYDRMSAAYEEQETRNKVMKEKLTSLPVPPSQQELDALSDQLANARIYEAAVANYDNELENFSRLSGDIAEKLRLAEEFKKGAEAINDARATLKANLAPIMSRIASALIADMTHGKLSSIIVDEDMEITVDGQRLQTLSGGGETVANIALRIALGQTLVARTFPVFFGDEMDADADDVRREAVTIALKTLLDTGRLKQVILITHRGVDVADHILDLGNTE